MRQTAKTMTREEYRKACPHLYGNDQCNAHIPILKGICWRHWFCPRMKRYDIMHEND